MFKYIAILTALLILGGCATNRGQGDLPLQYESSSSTLVLADDLPQLPAEYFAIPGYVFVAREMAFHPGKQRISYSCPGEWEWRQVTHYVPSVEFTFQTAKKYELYCDNGYPKIRILGGGE